MATWLISLMAAPYRACVRSRSLDPDPRGFPLPQSQQGTTNTDNQWITEGSVMGHGDDLARCKTQVKKTGAIKFGTIEACDADLPVQNCCGELPGCRTH